VAAAAALARAHAVGRAVDDGVQTVAAPGREIFKLSDLKAEDALVATHPKAAPVVAEYPVERVVRQPVARRVHVHR
jgi:hypothetical protein